MAAATYAAFSYEGWIQLPGSKPGAVINQKVGGTFCHDGDIDSAKLALAKVHDGKSFSLTTITPCVSLMRVSKKRPLY
jgi:hypothetical protein